MTADSSQQILILVLGLALAALACKTFKSQPSKEPFQNKISYKSSFNSALPTSSAPTSDVYSASSTTVTPADFDPMAAQQNSAPYNLSQNDQNHFEFASMAGITKAADFSSKQFKANKGSNYPDPKDMLPQADMNNQILRDPSDPSNFIYDRPVFTLSRSTNKNESDPIRGDLQITSKKTGWFDSTLSRPETLKRGYMANFMDTKQMIDLQDVIYQTDKNADQTAYLNDVKNEYGSAALRPDSRFETSHSSLAL